MSPEEAQQQLKLKKSRKKHKNSKLGCVQCKERRMKCNETLPECRNCRIRQEKIPCSFLSFTPDQKREFLQKKALQELANSPPLNLSSPSDGSASSPGVIKIKMISHFKPNALKSQQMNFFNEPQESIQSRLYYLNLINQSLVVEKGLFSAHLTFSAFWLQLQLSKKLKFSLDSLTEQEIASKEVQLDYLKRIGISHKAEVLSYLGSVISQIIDVHSKNDTRSAVIGFSKTTIPTICLQSADILTQGSLRFFFINGAVSILKDLYSGISDSSPIANFIAKSALSIHRSLFTPNYSFDIFNEILEVTLEIKPFVDNSNDPLLIGRFNELIMFLDVSIIKSPLKSHYNTEFITSYPPIMLYPIFHKFYEIMPSETFTINLTNSPIHGLVYLMYYSIARALDNIFPEVRYVTHFRFIGPTNLYPFDVLQLIESLPDELRSFGIYFSRILAFFSRRIEFFTKYLRILNPFPDNLAEYRYDSRKVKVNEVFLDNFRNVKIKKHHYPSVIDHDFSNLTLEESLKKDESFSTNFNAFFSLHLDFHSEFSRSASYISDTYRLLKTGLLECDYDPLDNDWTGEPQDNSMLSFDKYNEDREILLKRFINNE